MLTLTRQNNDRPAPSSCCVKLYNAPLGLGCYPAHFKGALLRRWRLYLRPLITTAHFAISLPTNCQDVERFSGRTAYGPGGADRLRRTVPSSPDSCCELGWDFRAHGHAE